MASFSSGGLNGFRLKIPTSISPPVHHLREGSGLEVVP
jgi:hypothetical protein